MNKKNFIKWIKSLGFRETWETYDGEYSMSPDSNVTWMNGSKVYFTFDVDIVRIYYSKMIINGPSFGSNLGYFPLSSIGDFEKMIIVNKLLEYFDEIPDGFKKYLRDSKIKNILGD